MFYFILFYFNFWDLGVNAISQSQTVTYQSHDKCHSHSHMITCHIKKSIENSEKMMLYSMLNTY